MKSACITKSISVYTDIDLVIQKEDTGECLSGLEIKLTALPDNTTCNFNEDSYGSEIVVRPDTIVYLACSIVSGLQNQLNQYMSCPRLKDPVVSHSEIKNIILGDGQTMLSPERRFDAIIFNSPELFF